MLVELFDMCCYNVYTMQAFIQALLSTAIFSLKIEFFLLFCSLSQ